MQEQQQDRPRFLHLMTDFAFKRIFFNENNKELMIHFLQDLLPKRVDRIVELQYIPNEVPGEINTERSVSFDFYCKNEKDEQFIVEVQRGNLQFFKDRMLFYGSRAIQEQGRKGEWDYHLKPIFVIGIVEESFPDAMGEVHRIYSMMDEEKFIRFNDTLTLITIELGNFNQEADALKTNKDKWLYMLKNLYKLAEVPKSLKDHIFMKILDLAEYAALSEVERRQYDSNLKSYRDYNAMLSYGKKLAREEGLKEGREEGFVLGREEGKEEGREEGREEGKRLQLKQTILLFKNKGYTHQEIADFLSMSLSEIDDLMKG